eukprot:TRINITY_DN1879_c0_g4_i3.p1 TRINITY_DN1879_c0_g4~~TRINITY_DN1879_c0_g4_i3.p1  ORF type:complete len:417 (-),score=44.66 TRINITY_DN1879_c0_g4_i3:81-1331(-)
MCIRDRYNAGPPHSEDGPNPIQSPPPRPPIFKSPFAISLSNLYPDITERVVAAESLHFLYDHLNFIKPRMIALLESVDHSNIITESLNEVKDIIPLMKSFIYQTYMPQIIKSDNLFNNIASLKWEIKDKDSMVDSNNIYIERLTYLVKDYRDRLSSLGGGSIPRYTHEFILKDIISFCFKQLVENYAKVKKCTPLGRAQMLNDFQTIVKNLEACVDAKPLPLKEYVENYIHAWNIGPDDLLDFVIKKKNYPFRVLWALFQSANQVNNMRKNDRKIMEKKIEREYVETIKNHSIMLPPRTEMHKPRIDINQQLSTKSPNQTRYNLDCRQIVNDVNFYKLSYYQCGQAILRGLRKNVRDISLFSCSSTKLRSIKDKGSHCLFVYMENMIFQTRPWKPCLLYTSPSPRDGLLSRMPSSA